MRVVGGEAKGFHLRGVPSADTRPTSDKVREAIFDVLGDSVSAAHVLDLFAGTGALGIEALSRGAESAIFVERSGVACAVIRDNLRRTRMAERAHVLRMPVHRALLQLESSERRFDVVLADPPYADPHSAALMKTLGFAPILSGSAIVVLEHSTRSVSEDQYGRLRRWRYKVYGDTAVSFYESVGEAA